MIIGLPKECRVHEGRVALTPGACSQLIEAGHEVHIETNAGLLSGYPDGDYEGVGAMIEHSLESLYETAGLIVKVKEPQSQEIKYLQPGHILFSYLHLAAYPDLTQSLLDIGLTAIGFEIIREGENLPLLRPMSMIAGRLAAQIGTGLLHGQAGGKGILLGALNGGDSGTDYAVEHGHTIVLGAGNAGETAMKELLQTGADVDVFDINLQRLQTLKASFPQINIFDAGSPGQLADRLKSCDLLIGAVLSAGCRAPVVVSREMVQQMPEKSVIVDIAIDQGGCVETSRQTDWRTPTYLDEGVIHFCVTNMPGAVHKTATQVLSEAILPYVSRIASGALSTDEVLQGGIYLSEGQIQYDGLK